MLEGPDAECDMVVAGVFDGAWVVGAAVVGDGEVDVGAVEDDDAGTGVDEAEGMGADVDADDEGAEGMGAGADVGTGAGTVGKEGDEGEVIGGGASREAEDVDAEDRVEVGGVD
jgi:hypothetical protein